MKFKKILLIFSLFFVSCDKDPISGLERGWIWGDKDEKNEATLTINCEKNTIHVKLYDSDGYDGNKTDESKVIADFFMYGPQKKEFDIKTNKDYWVYVIGVGFPVQQNLPNLSKFKKINIKKSCTLEVSNGGISGC